MKKVLLGLVAMSWVAWQVNAAEEEWMTDLAKAQAKAKEEKKLVFMDFTGSDWCPPCKKLHKDVLSSKEFTDYAKENLVLVVVDFPRTKPQSDELKKANKELAKKFQISGYPTVVVLDGNGKEVSKEVGYSGTDAKEYVGKLKALKKAGSS